MNDHAGQLDVPAGAGDPATYELGDEPEILVIGLSGRTSNAAEANPETGIIGAFWEQFTSGALSQDNLERHESREVVAAYTDYESDENGAYTYTLGVRVTNLGNVPDGLTGVRVPAQTFASIAVGGDHRQTIPATWARIRQVFPNDQMPRRRFLADAEVYYDDRDAGIATARILLGVEPT